jgi:phage protein D
METVAKNTAQIIINGKNVTGDVSRCLSKITYSDRLEYESDDLSLVFEDASGRWQSSWYPQQGDSLQVKFAAAAGVLDCGAFEIDDISLEFPPDTLTVKAIAASITQSLRTKNSKAFEEQTLRDMVQYFADRHTLKITGDTSRLQQIEIERKTQDRQTDLSFLAELAKEYGIVFSVRGDTLVFMDADALERAAPVLTLRRSAISSARFRDKTSEVYAGAIISKRNAKENDTTKWSVVDGKPGEGDILIIDAGAENYEQAMALGQAGLKNKKREKYSASITVPGNTRLVSGVNIGIDGVGRFSGKWIILSSTHSMDPAGGYTTNIEARKVLQEALPPPAPLLLPQDETPGTPANDIYTPYLPPAV